MARAAPCNGIQEVFPPRGASERFASPRDGSRGGPGQVADAAAAKEEPPPGRRLQAGKLALEGREGFEGVGGGEAVHVGKGGGHRAGDAARSPATRGAGSARRFASPGRAGRRISRDMDRAEASPVS